MDHTELATTKLIILSIVRRIPAITLSQLTTLALDTLYMDYFGFAVAYDALIRDHMIAAGIRKNESVRDATGRPVVRCDITERGQTVLHTLENRIPLPIRSYLAQESAAWHKDIRRRRQLTAEVNPDADGQYQVRLRQMEGHRSIVDLSLSIPDKSLARLISEHWQRQPSGMYLSLLALLTGEPALRGTLAGLGERQAESHFGVTGSAPAGGPGPATNDELAVIDKDAAGLAPPEPLPQEQRLI